MARFRVTAADGSYVEVDAFDWMMAMSRALQRLGSEASGWVCDARPGGDMLVTDSQSGNTWVVHPLDGEPGQQAPAVTAGPPPLPSWLASKASMAPKMGTVTPPPAPARGRTITPRSALPPQAPLPIEPPPQPKPSEPTPDLGGAKDRTPFAERARENEKRSPSPTAPNPKWAHRGQVPPPKSGKRKRMPNDAKRPEPVAREVIEETRPAPPPVPVAKKMRPDEKPAPIPLSMPNPTKKSLDEPVDLAEQLFDLSMDITGAPDKNTACSEALQIVLNFVRCEAGSVLRGTINDSALTFVAVSGPVGDQLLGIRVPFGEGIAGACFDSGLTLQVNDVTADDRHNSSLDKKTGFTTKAVLCVPVRTDDMFFGCMQLINPFNGFEAWHVEVAETVCGTLATNLASRS